MAISGGKFEDQNVKKNVGSEDSPHGSAKKKKKTFEYWARDILFYIIAKNLPPVF